MERSIDFWKKVSILKRINFNFLSLIKTKVILQLVWEKQFENTQPFSKNLEQYTANFFMVNSIDFFYVIFLTIVPAVDPQPANVPLRNKV